jgi:tetratricopeptide (TPR) repeat protein
MCVSVQTLVLRRFPAFATALLLASAAGTGQTPSSAQTAPGEAHLIAEANALRLRLRTDDAIRVLDRAAALYPKSASIYVLRSDSEKDRGNMPAALSDLQKALAITPHNLEILKKRAKVNDITGHLSEAIKDYDYILAKQPKDKRTWNERAIACKRLKLYAEAAHDFNEAANCAGEDRSQHDILYDRTQMYMLSGESKKAMDSANDLIKKFPELSRGYWLRAQLYEKAGQTVLAGRDRAKATEIDENFMPGDR